ncbi:MAG: rhomboid family intramembrane serine protease [Euryarchaeota archaeon]|jgi:membrane associated rhomboid family serine protease|nr:rhomboid family intramembrane serine protease [Euryarchaeota archaeon]
MDLVFLPLSLISLVAIGIMIGTIVVAYLKKITLTYAIIIANFFVFLISLFFRTQIINELGFRPIYLSLEMFPNVYTLFTSMFVHSDFLHILGNLFVFFFMGVAFEQRIGPKKFLIIYLITGVCGALTHALLNIDSMVPLIGASGAIFGILGAFAYAYPRDEIVMPVPIGIMFIMRIKVIYATILFAVFETIIVMFSVQDSTAHFAHLGGLASGVILAAILLRNRAERQSQTTGIRPLDYMQIKKDDTINFSHLTKLVKTAEEKKILQRIEKEDVLQVRDMWLDHFLEKITCPVCNKPLNHLDRKIWCEQNHFQTDY